MYVFYPQSCRMLMARRWVEEPCCKPAAYLQSWSLTPQVFLTFNFWAGLFCLYNTILLIVHTVKTPKIDPQQVALIAM